MTAYEEAMSKLVDRVETLESRAHGVMDRLREFDGYVERLEALELEAKSVPLKTLAVCSEVDVLVKAAAQAEAYFRAELAPTSDVLLFLDGIRDALKPFEAQK